MNTDSTEIPRSRRQFDALPIRQPPRLGKAHWNTGEILEVTDNGTYLDLSSSLSWIDGLGLIEGLLASNINPGAWRVTESSLFDPVPEPTTLSLLAIGIGCLTAIAMMRRPSPTRAT